jgi:F-type H+-transporting ATPase subunit alpha
MMELLKQWVFEPITVEKQVASIYAWSKGYLDAVDVSKIRKAEKELYLALDEEKTVLEAIAKDKEIKEDTEKKLVEVINKVVELNK